MSCSGILVVVVVVVVVVVAAVVVVYFVGGGILFLFFCIFQHLLSIFIIAPLYTQMSLTLFFIKFSSYRQCKTSSFVCC